MTDYLPVRKLIWDTWNVEHIAKHGMVPREVEEVFGGEPMVVESYKGRLQMIGPNAAGQMLSVIIGPDRTQAAGTYYVFSARRAKRKERRSFVQDKEGSAP